MKQKGTLILLPFLLFLFIFEGSGQNYDPQQKFPVGALHEDLNVLRALLQKSHPGLYWYISGEEFEKEFEALKQGINSPLTELEFYTKLLPFIARLHCGHTQVFPSSPCVNYYSSDKVDLFPFEVVCDSSRIYIMQNLGSDLEVGSGTEILSVNSIPMKEIVEKMQPMCWSDGFTPGSEFMLEERFPIYYFFLYGSSKDFQMQLRDPGGTIYTKTIASATMKEMDSRRQARYAGRNPKETFSMNMIPDMNTAVFTIDGFQGKGFREFLRSSFRTINRSGIEHLVIDLRRNGGGDDVYGQLLYSYIAQDTFRYYDSLESVIHDFGQRDLRYGHVPSYIKWAYRLGFIRKNQDGKYYLRSSMHKNLGFRPFRPRRNAYGKKVYILISNETYSAAAEFAAIAKYNKRAVFIGQETGGAYCGNTSGEFISFELPNTLMKGFIPLFKYKISVRNCPHGKGVDPDYEVKTSIPDMVKYVDTELQFTLNLIRTVQ